MIEAKDFREDSMSLKPAGSSVTLEELESVRTEYSKVHELPKLKLDRILRKPPSNTADLSKYIVSRFTYQDPK